jgi:hypothetical protein
MVVRVIHEQACQPGDYEQHQEPAEDGMDSPMAVRARFQMRLHEFGMRYRGQRHREEAGLPAPLVEEPDLDAAAAELVELFRLRHRGVEARSGYAPAA